MKKWYAEFASAIKNNHNLVHCGLDLVSSKEHLETLLWMRTNVRKRLARLVLLHGHNFLPAVDILANVVPIGLIRMNTSLKPSTAFLFFAYFVTSWANTLAHAAIVTPLFGAKPLRDWSLRPIEVYFLFDV